MKKRTHEDLLNTCAEICYFAQEHSNDESAWGPRNSPELEDWMQHTSFVVSCFIAQNTKDGSAGVEWEIVWKELCGPVLSLKEWLKIIENRIELYGGAKVRG